MEEFLIGVAINVLLLLLLVRAHFAYKRWNNKVRYGDDYSDYLYMKICPGCGGGIDKRFIEDEGNVYVCGSCGFKYST